MPEIISTASIASLTRLTQPILKDLYTQAKKIGIRGLDNWQTTQAAGKIARRIKRIDNVQTLWTSNQAKSIQTFIHPPKVIFNNQPKITTRLHDIPYQATIIEGIVGQGKSILLRSIAVGEILSNDAKSIPIFIELRSISNKQDLNKAIINYLESYDIEISDDCINYLYRSGKISILLDGFDEIEEDLVSVVYQDIDYLVTKYPELKIIITSRPENEIQKHPLFVVCKISPLTPAEYPAFLEKLGLKSEKSQEIRRSIRESPSKISSLISTPLMLTLVVLVYETESKIPESLPEFFERLFQVVFSKHDHLKDNFNRTLCSGLSERSLQLLFEAFCCMCIQSGHTTSLSNEEFYAAYEQAIEYVDDIKCDADSFKSDIIDATCLMLADGIDTIVFLHKSILEYYAASFIKRLDEDSAKIFYSEAISREYEWNGVLHFLKLIDAYRYYRDYVLPACELLQQGIINKLTTDNDAEFSEALNSILLDFVIFYRSTPESNGELRLSGCSARKETPYIDFGNFYDHMVIAIFQEIPGRVKAKEFQEIFNTPVDLDQKSLNYIEIPFKKILKQYGTTNFRKATGIFSERLKSIKQEGDRVLKSQEKKRLIFSKPTKKI